MAALTPSKRRLDSRAKLGRASLATVGLLAVALIIGTQFITIFVIPPDGAMPKGATLLMRRADAMTLLDSPDAWCKRNRGSARESCRSATFASLGRHLRLPYSRTLDVLSRPDRPSIF
jgi:hypothetical protein